MMEILKTKIHRKIPHNLNLQVLHEAAGQRVHLKVNRTGQEISKMLRAQVILDFML